MPDGGVLLGGDSWSEAGGNKTAPSYGYADIWLVRLDAEGNELWQQSLGGDWDDTLGAVLPLPGGEMWVTGVSDSAFSGNKNTGKHGGGSDWWVLRLDAGGNILWETNYGTFNSGEYLFASTLTADGGLILGGDSGDRSGDRTAKQYGGFDYWAMRLAPDGSKRWDVSFGGIADDLLTNIVEMPDGGFLLCGETHSGIGGNKTTPFYGEYPWNTDVWLVRVDARGKRLWERTLGGLYYESLKSVRGLPDGGCIVGAQSGSYASGTKTSPNYGIDDYWIIRLDAQGQQLWDRSFGGGGSDRLFAVDPRADGGFLAAGWSPSPPCPGKTSPLIGTADVWLVKMKSDGSLAWDRAVGTAEGGALRGFVPGLGGRAFVIAASARTDGGTRYIYVWLGQTDAQAALTTRVELPWGIPDVFTMFGRTADGGLYMAANYLDPPPPPYVYNYRVLKIGPAPIAASTDHAELLSLVDLQGEISREGFLTGLVGIGGLTYVTEYSTDLRTWLPLATNTVATTDVKVRDLGAATSPHRFYRARLLE